MTTNLDAYQQLTAARAAAEAAQQQTVDAVVFARGAGASWQEIGAALGVTKQAAAQRYGSRVAAHVAVGKRIEEIKAEIRAADADPRRIPEDQPLPGLAGDPLPVTEADLGFILERFLDDRGRAIALEGTPAEAERHLRSAYGSRSMGGPDRDGFDRYSIHGENRTGVTAWFGPKLGEHPGTRHVRLTWRQLAKLARRAAV